MKERKMFIILWSVSLCLSFCLLICVPFQLTSFIRNTVTSNKIISENMSLNGEFKAIIFEREAGATTHKSYQLSILKNSEKLKNETGNVFISYSSFDVEWKDNETLVVKIHDEEKEIFKLIKQIKGVEIRYETESKE